MFVVFQILDFVREYPLFVKTLLVAPIVVEMVLDSVGTVAAPAQDALQQVRRLLTTNKAANLTSLSKLRPWDPFLSFAFFCRKFVSMLKLAEFSFFPSFLDLSGGSAV